MSAIIEPIEDLNLLATPEAGKKFAFMDADGILKEKDSNGIITPIVKQAVLVFNPSLNAAQRTIAAHILTDINGNAFLLPNHSYVVRSWYEVITTFTSAGADAGTIALGYDTDGAAAVKAAIAISDGTNPWDAGNHEGIQVGTVAAFGAKTTDNRAVEATVAVDALLAGKLYLFIEYVTTAA